MNNIGRISPAISDSEDSSDEEMTAETQALAEQAQEIQQVLRDRLQLVQEMNQPNLEALEQMNYLRAVEARVENLEERNREVKEIQQNLSNTLEKGEKAINSRQKELNVLPAQVHNLRQQLQKAPQNPLLNFATTLGGRVGEYISNPKSCEKYYATQSKPHHT